MLLWNSIVNQWEHLYCTYYQLIFFFLSIFFFFYENYANKKVCKSNNYNRENVTVVLFCFQNDLNVKANESWLSFRHLCLYTWTLSLSLKLVITNIIENISHIFKFAYSLKTICKLIFYIHTR